MRHYYFKLFFAALLCIATTGARAHDFVVHGIYYNILSAEDKTVAVTFKGDEVGTLRNEYYNGCVVIPESITAYNGTTYTVTNIGDKAFYRCYGLTSITIPKSIINIGSYAFGYCRGLTSIVIPNSVTNIGDHTFYECTSIASIEIPNSVTSIGNNAFENCTRLTSIEIPNSVTSIGDYAFRNCTGLTSIEIPNSVTSIGTEVFSYCTGLSSITIPNSVTSIGTGVFSYCTGLSSITIPNSVTSIGNQAFKNCTSLKILHIENSKEALFMESNDFRLSQSLLYDCPLETLYVGRNLYMSPNLNFKTKTNLSVTIDNNVTNIDFLNCENIIDFNIPESAIDIDRYDFIGTGWWKNLPDGLVYKDNWLLGYKGNMPTGNIEITYGTKRIAHNAFPSCTNINSITLPNSITYIGYCAFYNCTGIVDFNIPECVTDIDISTFENTGWWKNQADGLIYKDNWLLGYKGNMPTGNIEITYGTKRIAHNAFSSCTNINSLTLPNSITSIGESAFRLCTGLTSITMPNSVTKIGRNAFSGIESYVHDVHINDLSAWCNVEFESGGSNPLASGKLYLNGKLITNLEIPDNVTVINPYAFYHSNIKSVTVPKNVMAIGKGAFSHCIFNQLVINNSSLEITKGADNYGDIARYANVVITEGKEEYIKDDDFYFHIDSNILAHYAGNNTDITLPANFKGKKYRIGENAFQYNSNIKNVSIPNSVTSIGNNAFNNCVRLESIEIPNSVTSIGECAFGLCTGLTIITIPNSVTSIENSVFNNCTSLASITIPNSVTSIGNHAFNNCTSLASIEIPKSNSITSIGNYAFNNCTSLTSIEIPKSNSITSIGDYAFNNCTGLTNIKIPNSVTSIGSYAFFNCRGLENIEIQYGLTSIKAAAFGQCSNLKNITIPESVRDIEYSVFGYCTSLKSIELPNSVTTIPQKIFYECTELSDIKIGNNVTSIENDAFVGCNNLQMIIPQSVTYIGRGAFGGCSQAKLVILHKINIDGTIPRTAHIYVPTTEIKDYYTNYSDSVKYIFTEDATTTATTLSLKIKNNIPGILKSTNICIDNYENASDSLFLTGLEPNKDYNLQYSAETESTNTIQGSIKIKTDPLVFKTLKAKATSNTRAVICAETNISEEESGTGFEWRRIDAPDLVPSEFAPCAVHEGVMEGALHNLSANTYYKYRPCYTSQSGKSYYGEWIGFGTADAYVYFTPTVHTYATASAGTNAARLSGYVLAGSDDIIEQGFEYWPVGKAETAVMHSTHNNGNVKRVTATGQRMSVVVEELDYGTVYMCRAYARTAKETVYGEEQSFETSYPNSIEENREESITIQTSGNTVYINGCNENVLVYTLFGIVVYNGPEKEITLNSGTYIVKAGNITKKIQIR